MKRNLIIILLFSFTAINAQKNQKPVEILKCPILYNTSPDGNIITDPKVERDDVQDWVVCSDRDNNPTYQDRNGSTSFKFMNFLDAFWVSEDAGDYLHIYKIDNTNEFQLGDGKKKDRKTKIVNNILDYGWAPKSKLLLWLKGEVNIGGLSRKVLPIFNEKNVTDGKMDVSKGDIPLYKNSNLTGLSENKIKMFQFLYIFKEDQNNNSVLVGLSNKAFSRQLPRTIAGWVNKDILTEWGDRICLEPNWDESAVTQRKSLNIKTSLFYNLDDAILFQTDGTPKAPPSWSNDPYNKRMPANQKRFPILENKGNGIYKTGYITALFDGDGKKVEESGEAAEAAKHASEDLKELRKINLVFVVDCSNGMEEYVNAMKLTISKIQDRIVKIKEQQSAEGDVENQWKYKYGSVVYRDVEDKNCSEDLSVTDSKLSTNADDVISFLDDQSKKASCKPSEKNIGALRSGIYDALRMINSVENCQKQTNIIILIGGKDGSDKDANLTIDKMTDLMSKTKTQLLCFQVKSNVSSAFSSFPSSMKQIFDNYADKYNKEQIKSKDDVLFKSEFKLFGTRCYVLDYPSNSPVQGLLAYSGVGSQDFYKTEQIYDKVDSLMKSSESKIQSTIDVINNKFNGFGKKTLKVNAAVKEFMKQLGKEMNEKDLSKKYSGNDYQFFVPGYTCLTNSKLDESNNLYKNVLYLTQDELIDMKKEFENLITDLPPSKARAALKESFKRLMITHLGATEAMRAIQQNEKLEFIFKLISGLPTKNDLLKKYKINDFDDTQKMDDRTVRLIQNEIQDSFNKLVAALNDESIIEKLEWGHYYWVSEDLLPHDNPKN